MVLCTSRECAGWLCAMVLTVVVAGQVCIVAKWIHYEGTKDARKRLAQSLPRVHTWSMVLSSLVLLVVHAGNDDGLLAFLSAGTFHLWPGG